LKLQQVPASETRIDMFDRLLTAQPPIVRQAGQGDIVKCMDEVVDGIQVKALGMWTLLHGTRKIKQQFLQEQQHSQNAHCGSNRAVIVIMVVWSAPQGHTITPATGGPNCCASIQLGLMLLPLLVLLLFPHKLQAYDTHARASCPAAAAINTFTLVRYHALAILPC
jgi:hypothetical protein